MIKNIKNMLSNKNLNIFNNKIINKLKIKCNKLNVKINKNKKYKK